MRELRKLVRQVIKEARTKQPGDLPQTELLDLVNHLLQGDGIFDFSEKFAGSHAEILLRPSGEFSVKSKAGRSAGSGWSDPRGKSKQITDQMSTLSAPSTSRRFAFELIATRQRPDYINYLIGDVPAAVEYSGELSQEEAHELNNSQSLLKFVSLEDITYDSFNISPRDTIDLENIKIKLESQPLTRKQLKELGLKVSQIVVSTIPQSLLGGPIEGVMVLSPQRLFKIPNPQYAEVQKLQSPLYAMFSGRGGVSKREIKSRLIIVDPSDRLIQDMVKYLESISDLPSGFRTFFTEQESFSLLGLIDSAVAGDQEAGQKLYDSFNKRINNQSSWVNTQ